MADEDRRIARLLRCEALSREDGTVRDRLSAAAEAGFRFVAMDSSAAAFDRGPEIESEAKRWGLHIIRVEQVMHCRLESVQTGAQRRALAQALSRTGFQGIILCGGDDSTTSDSALFAAARALLRDLDRLDWASFH